MAGNVLQVLLSMVSGSWVGGLAVALLAVAGLMSVGGRIFQAEKDVQRRIQRAKSEERESARLRLDAALAAIAAKFGASGSGADVKVLRGKLIRAGYYEPQAVLIFFSIRLLCAFLLAVAAGGVLFFWTSANDKMLALVVLGTGMFGYVAPSFALDRKVRRNVEEHREAFPEMMDLLVVCTQAGLSMEAGVQRIARELSPAYPSLGRNLEMAVREIRTGKPLGRAIESLALRLGIEEATSFSTLLQQSEELGSSLSQSLRAYSDDMRHKRMMKAEEKAYALPAKMVVPLTLFVFPVLFIVILLPVVISVMAARS